MSVLCRDYVGSTSGLCRTIVVSGIPGWSTRVEYQGVHGGVSDGNKVMGHVGMCEDTTSERELRKTGMSSLSRISLPSQPVRHHLPGPARRDYVGSTSGLCRYCVGTMSLVLVLVLLVPCPCPCPCLVYVYLPYTLPSLFCFSLYSHLTSLYKYMLLTILTIEPAEPLSEIDNISDTISKRDSSAVWVPDPNEGEHPSGACDQGRVESRRTAVFFLSPLRVACH